MRAPRAKANDDGSGGRGAAALRMGGAAPRTLLGQLALMWPALPQQRQSLDEATMFAMRVVLCCCCVFASSGLCERTCCRLVTRRLSALWVRGENDTKGQSRTCRAGNFSSIFFR